MQDFLRLHHASYSPVGVLIRMILFLDEAGISEQRKSKGGRISCNSGLPGMDFVHCNFQPIDFQECTGLPQFL